MDPLALRVLTIVIVIFIFAIYFILQNAKKISSFLLFFIALALTIWKIETFINSAIKGYQIYPVEFSHITYFVVGFAVLFGIKRLYFFAGVSAFYSGFFYFCSTIIDPKAMIENTTLGILRDGIISHSLLLFISLFMLFSTILFKKRDIFISIIGFFIIIIYVHLVNIKVIFPDANTSTFITTKLVDGTALSYLTGKSENSGVLKVLFTISVYLFINLATLPIFLLNRYIRKNKMDNFSVGLIPFIKYFNEY